MNGILLKNNLYMCHGAKQNRAHAEVLAVHSNDGDEDADADAGGATKEAVWETELWKTLCD